MRYVIHQTLMESRRIEQTNVTTEKNQIEKRDCDYTYSRHDLHSTNLNGTISMNGITKQLKMDVLALKRQDIRETRSFGVKR